MPSMKKYLKEFETLRIKEELDDKAKKEYLEIQIQEFQKQAYRCQVDVEIAKKYIKVGEIMENEEAYTLTGEKKIQEALQAMRAIVITIDKLIDLRDKIQLEEDSYTDGLPVKSETGYKVSE